MDSFELKLKVIHNADPVRQIEKGYSLLKSHQGKLISGLKDIAVGDPVTAEISDGFFTSKITSTKEKK